MNRFYQAGVITGLDNEGMEIGQNFTAVNGRTPRSCENATQENQRFFC